MEKKSKTEFESGIEHVIFSKSKNAIWAGGPRISYITHMQAKTELDRQMNQITPEIRENLDWQIEEKSWHCEIIKKRKSDDFGDF